ncbi:uncharacterized protein SETTUDRAFT_173693 [Exserohilum turcica Et28A]|uniref:Uncharacterized protein n=1 Tax=Exserohilum turcicum (strain 28A) TaxID=671987 RepID=R0JKR3_EXST2|nr:uncharacterized protein SETTUDRAFT_173693 [Exserohilum turcica Et28A]EOA81893.1 hypothetical protein SETTUDRAFT_173693 [Exserohilum turcica Et28A]
MFGLRNALVNGVKALISQFVPKHHAHPLIERCWGSISIVDQIILKTSEEIYRHQAKDSPSRSSSTYIVRHLPNDEYMNLYLLQDFGISVTSCDFCDSKHRYTSVEDAINHLRLAHLSAQRMHSKQNLELLKHWVTPTTDADMEISTERLLKLLETLTRRVNKLLSRAIDMRQSVANGSQELDEGYLLRSTLVTAAEKIFQFLYYSAHSFSTLREHGFAPAGPELLASSSEHVNDESGAEMFATLADLAMSRARDDLLLMTQTGDNGRSMFHFKAPPQFTIYLGLYDLVKRPLLWDMSIMELYRDHLSALRFQASRKPSKRILRELYLLDEEIEVVESVYMQQHKAEQVLCKVLSTDEIKLVFEDREKSIEILFSQFRKDLERATKALRHNIEILEEGNSKAILIFTLVTIVFLPLSFIASVFGMNTSDIRNMDSSQTLFWAIALPVTASIGTLSLMAAYGQTAIVNGVHRFKDDIMMKRPTFRPHQFIRNRNKHGMDEERADRPNKVATTPSRRRLDPQHSDPWLHSKRWSSRRQNLTTGMSGSNGNPILVRTATAGSVYGKSRQRSALPT